jgi:hypothetical protein
MARLLRSPSYLVIFSGFTLAAGAALAADAKTPLGKWMKPNVGAPFASEDYPTVQKNLTIVANEPPPMGDYGSGAASRPPEQRQQASRTTTAPRPPARSATISTSKDTLRTSRTVNFRKRFPKGAGALCILGGIASLRQEFRDAAQASLC